jgi:O-antigen/teichoic acid export membrane protein
MRERLRSFLHQAPIRDALARYGAQGFGRWLGRGFWAVADQGLFAVSNFVLNVLLARWLVPQDYGVFSAVWVVFVLLTILHGGLLLEPMLIFGPGKYEGRLSEYLGVLLYGNFGFAALGSLLFLLVGLGFWLGGSYAVSSALWSLALAGPLILFQWLMRRACYALLKPHLAALGGALYMVLMLFGTYVLYERYWLSAAMAFGLMGFASLASGLLLTLHLRVDLPSLSSKGIVHEAFVNHWTYGRWAAITGVLIWVPQGACYLLLPVWESLEATAALRALMNTTMPVTHAYTALSVIFTPYLVQARGGAKFGRIIRLAVALSAFGAIMYWVLQGLFSRQLIVWLYGGQYSEYSNLLWLLGLLPLAYGIDMILGAALRALERPDRVFWGYGLSALVTLTVGLGFMVTWGVAGAMVGLLLSSMAATGAMARFLTALRVDTGSGEYKE